MHELRPLEIFNCFLASKTSRELERVLVQVKAALFILLVTATAFEPRDRSALPLDRHVPPVQMLVFSSGYSSKHVECRPGNLTYHVHGESRRIRELATE